MAFYRVWGKPPHFKCLNIFRSQTTSASIRKDEMKQKAPLKITQRAHLPTLACSPLCRRKHALKWGETFMNPLCSCFITLLISILISVGFLFQNITVHTLVFGEGICEPAPEAPPLPLPLWHHTKIWFKPKTAGREEGTQSQAMSLRPNHRGCKTSTWVLCACLSGVLLPISHLATCAHLINGLLIPSCKSLIMMLSRYRPTSEPARSMPLPTISQSVPRRPPAALVAFQPGFNPWVRQSLEPALLNSSLKRDFWMDPFHFLHSLMLWRIFFKFY